MNGKAICNTGPIITLSMIDRIDILRHLFELIAVPEEVHKEILEGGATNAGLANVALGSAGENYSQMYALLKSGEISQTTFDEFDGRHYSVETKLINLAKSLAKKMKTGQVWNSDYKVWHLS